MGSNPGNPQLSFEELLGMEGQYIKAKLHDVRGGWLFYQVWPAQGVRTSYGPMVALLAGQRPDQKKQSAETQQLITAHDFTIEGNFFETATPDQVAGLTFSNEIIV